MMFPTTSEAPPAAYGDTMRTVRLGQSCASDEAVSGISAAVVAVMARIQRDMKPLPFKARTRARLSLRTRLRRGGGGRVVALADRAWCWRRETRRGRARRGAIARYPIGDGQDEDQSQDRDAE